MGLGGGTGTTPSCPALGLCAHVLLWLPAPVTTIKQDDKIVFVEDKDADPYDPTTLFAVGAVVALDESGYFDGQGPRGPRPYLKPSKTGVKSYLQRATRNHLRVATSGQVIAAGLVLSQGVGATASGVLHVMNDSARAAWVAAGTISEGDQLAAEFATHFLEATLVIVASAPEGDGN